MNMYFIETERLKIRRLSISDFDNIKEALEDPLAMYAYEGAFNDKETVSRDVCYGEKFKGCRVISV